MQDIAYTLCFSPKARRVNLKIDPLKGLVVVLPRGFYAEMVPRILSEKKAWNEKHRPSILRAARRLESRRTIPASLYLPALDERLTVVVRDNGCSALKLCQSRGDTLELHGSGWVDPSVAASLLREWLKNRARQTLPGWLAQVAARHGLSYNRVSIRCQKTRWGSCSGKKTISLNCKLLFLDPPLVEHVLVHELCHTLQPNHSPEFWSLFNRLQPEAGLRHQQLQRLRHEAVPAWAERD
ncbi:MAG: M48 family metallopeptidase [Thermodesulfobacteriota bacterium]